MGLPGSALVIEKDASLEAAGTADAPIVFTSNSATPVAGDWGGLVFLGEQLTSHQWIAIGAIIVASVGTTLSSRPKPALVAD